jgi:ubiquinone biosynthesis protein Coq4
VQSREQFQQATKRTDAASLAQAVADAKSGKSSGRLQIATAMAWAAYSCPDATPEVFDNICSAWLGTGPTPEIPAHTTELPLADSFWEAFWTVIDGPEEGYDAISITLAVASLAAEVHEDFGGLAEHHAANHPGAKAALTNPVPGRTDVAALANCAENSLGRLLHDMIVDNDFDPEVLDREAVMLSEMPACLQYLNTRILQMHDVWHLVAGYDTSGTHETSISAFQLAQFGHNYSSMYLAAVSTISYYTSPRGFPILMQIIAEGWQHGRNTPPMMDVEWENEWHHSLGEIRQQHNITALRSVLPTDVMETMADGSLWNKLTMGYQLAKYSRRLRRAA